MTPETLAEFLERTGQTPGDFVRKCRKSGLFVWGLDAQADQAVPPAGTALAIPNL